MRDKLGLWKGLNVGKERKEVDGGIFEARRRQGTAMIRQLAAPAFFCQIPTMKSNMNGILLRPTTTFIPQRLPTIPVAIVLAVVGLVVCALTIVDTDDQDSLHPRSSVGSLITLLSPPPLSHFGDFRVYHGNHCFYTSNDCRPSDNVYSYPNETSTTCC